jgi:hypothetical protein
MPALLSVIREGNMKDSNEVKLSLVRQEESKKVVLDSKRFIDKKNGGQVELELETYSDWHTCYYTQGKTAVNVSKTDTFYSSGSIGVKTDYGKVRFSTLKCEEIGTLAPSFSPPPSHPPTPNPTAMKPSANPTIVPSLMPTNSPSVVPTGAPSAAPTNSPTAIPTTGPSPCVVESVVVLPFL